MRDDGCSLHMYAARVETTVDGSEFRSFFSLVLSFFSRVKDEWIINGINGSKNFSYVWMNDGVV